MGSGEHRHRRGRVAHVARAKVRPLPRRRKRLSARGQWGPGDLEYFLEALTDGTHEERENYVRWNDGDTFDRTAFDLIEINAALQMVR